MEFSVGTEAMVASCRPETVILRGPQMLLRFALEFSAGRVREVQRLVGLLVKDKPGDR